MGTRGVAVEKCGHVFCSKCINTWCLNYYSLHEDETSAPCPKCYQKIDNLKNYDIHLPQEANFKSWNLKQFGTGFDDSTVISCSKEFNRVLYSGHLWKRGHFVKNWLKRYAILRQENLDVYFIYFRSNSPKEKVLGFAPL